jgi:hypothetical protein
LKLSDAGKRAVKGAHRGQANREAALDGDPHAVRLAHRRARFIAINPAYADARAEARGQAGQDAGAHRGSGQTTARELEAGSSLENAQGHAAYESPRTTKLYDRTGDEITLDEVERITI